MSRTNIVVLGGSFGGIGVAQNILASIPHVKVTMVNISKDWYFNIAAARILAKPNSAPLDKVSININSLSQAFVVSRPPDNLSYQGEFLRQVL